MSVIPLKAYRLVERRLRDRWELAARAKAELYDAQMAAYAVSAPPMDQEKVGHGPGDRTQAAAQRVLAAEKKVEEAAKWEEAIRQDTLRRTEHYCDGMNFESKVVKTLGINAIPFYILTDAQHQVLDSGDDASKLDAMLKKHLRGEDSTQGLNAQPSKIR